ncbi:MAG: hypothetical protein JO131_02545 [Gammaproteobacteria bacterium]|nr:hypothetical protein [Gammaproteobacteria bacterium]
MPKFLLNLIISIICFSIFSISTQAKSDNTSNKLYLGESIQYTAGFPNLVKFINGDSNKPLIIFIPGNSHLARIAYGFPRGNERDFLSYWFHKNGYPFLAISYPIGNSIYEKNYPNYTIQNWSKSIIEIAAQVINEKHLSKNVIILAWSMGGELVQPINVYAKESHIKIQLFIGLSAVTPLYNLFPESFFNKLKPDNTGLADTQPFYTFFLEMLDKQNKMNQHVIIPP